MRSPERLQAGAEAEFFAGALFAEQFFMKQSRVHRALERLVRQLQEEDIPYAILGAMALNEYGYRRVTEDVDVLLTRAGLEAFKRANLGRGYVEKFPGSKGLRDTENDTPIDVVLSGDFPGDGKPKSVVFPDPEAIALAGDRVRLLPLPKLIELKLAAGLTAPHRLRDLADVVELIRRLGLNADFADPLDGMVREKYRELWHAAQSADDT